MAKNNATDMAVRSTWPKCSDGKLVGLGLDHITLPLGSLKIMMRHALVVFSWLHNPAYLI